jgi:hypothetical protein
MDAGERVRIGGGPSTRSGWQMWPYELPVFGIEQPSIESEAGRNSWVDRRCIRDLPYLLLGNGFQAVDEGSKIVHFKQNALAREKVPYRKGS